MTQLTASPADHPERPAHHVEGMNFYTRKWVRPEDLNANGSLFGGSLLRWIEEEDTPIPNRYSTITYDRVRMAHPQAEPLA